RRVIAVMKKPPANDLGIMKNPLPYYQNQPAVRDPSSSNQAPQQATHMVMVGEPTRVRRTQTWSYEGEQAISQLEVFTTHGRQDEHLTVILREEINRQYEIMQSPRQHQERPTSSSRQSSNLITPAPMGGVSPTTDSASSFTLSPHLGKYLPTAYSSTT